MINIRNIVIPISLLLMGYVGGRLAPDFSRETLFMPSIERSHTSSVASCDSNNVDYDRLSLLVTDALNGVLEQREQLYLSALRDTSERPHVPSSQEIEDLESVRSEDQEDAYNASRALLTQTIESSFWNAQTASDFYGLVSKLNDVDKTEMLRQFSAAINRGDIVPTESQFNIVE